MRIEESEDCSLICSASDPNDQLAVLSFAGDTAYLTNCLTDGYSPNGLFPFKYSRKMTDRGDKLDLGIKLWFRIKNLVDLNSLQKTVEALNGELPALAYEFGMREVKQ